MSGSVQVSNEKRNVAGDDDGQQSSKGTRADSNSSNDSAPACNQQHDYIFKFLIIGSAGVGKSCLMRQFVDRKFSANMSHTVGVEFSSRTVNVGGKAVKLQLWDTAGQERFRSVTRSYYRGAAGGILVYDLTARDSFNAVGNWLNDARTLASANIVMMLIGNKKDLEDDREVSFLEASRFAQENDMMFLETSALSGENVEECFLKVAHSILSKVESGDIDPQLTGSGIQLGDRMVAQRRRELIRQNRRSPPSCSC